jgi:HPt (histidine-containing phosphotransfer) domain-containing protein
MNPPTIAMLVFETLQANTGADFVLQLVEAFADEAPVLMARLRAAAAAGDADLFETTAHSLKSNGITFGATRLAELASRLEGQGLATEPDAVDELAAAVAAALVSLRAMARA